MVQAILAGRKTQTRRVVKPQPTLHGNITKFAWGAGTSGNTMPVVHGHKTASKCPYGKVGDLIWVRETWSEEPVLHSLRYKANLNDFGLEGHKAQGFKWKPSIFMPKAAARIWLRITNVRVERLHEITADDCRKEGKPNGGDTQDNLAMLWFKTLWQSINGSDSWNDNPWVWVIEFEVISKTGKP